MASVAQVQQLESDISGIAVRVDAVMTQMQEQDNRLRNQLDNKVTNIEKQLSTGIDRITHIETAVQGLTAQDITIMQTVIQALAGHDIPTMMAQIATVGNALQQHEQNFAGLQVQLTTHQQNVNKLQNDLAGIQQNQGSGNGPGLKPILDYKCWIDVGKLSNDRSRFRDWKVRFKDALKQ